MKKALVLLADGAEEIEAVVVIDVLRRADIDVTVAGLTGDGIVTCSRKVKIKPDMDIASAAKNAPYDVIILPGGLQGATALSKAAVVGEMLKDQEKCQRIIGAICAAPIAIKAHKIGVGKQITSYPAFKDQFTEYKYSEATVVSDGNLITSRGPATAMQFALEIVRQLCGEEVATATAAPMLVTL
uniref:protein deglycase n=1 Tax=Ciona savignyi TaxID=51511 RepID=H2YLH5_CIOSA